MRQLELDWGTEPARKPAPAPVALSLAKASEKTHGGARRGAGRKPGPRPIILHRDRGEHRGDLPVLITLRSASTMPSLRVERVQQILHESVRDTKRDGFRIVRYSIHDRHMHVLVEADDTTTLSTSMRSFVIRAAMRINYELHGRRQGDVWTGERYRSRALKKTSEVRHALRYLLGEDGQSESDVGEGEPAQTWRARWAWRRPAPAFAT